MEFRHYRLDDLDQVRPILSTIYATVHADAGPFRTVERFESRLASHASGADWHAVVAWDDDTPAGFVYAAPLGPRTRWWEPLIEPLPEEYTRETGTRTLGLFELMLLPPYRGIGLSRQLHGELLGVRAESRVSLLADPSHGKVLDLYTDWGYTRVGDMQPFPDSPRFAVMVLERT
jgi:GNAT superfamily N-acetyltransferase